MINKRRRVVWIGAGIAVLLGLALLWFVLNPAQKEFTTPPARPTAPQPNQRQIFEERKELLKQAPPSGEVLTEEQREERKQLLKQPAPPPNAPSLSERDQELRRQQLKQP